MSELTNYIKERMKELKWMFDVTTDDIDYINFMLGKIGELQALLSKIEELWMK